MLGGCKGGVIVRMSEDGGSNRRVADDRWGGAHSN